MILITGCAGYIGRHLARSLRADGLSVRGLDHNPAHMGELTALGVETTVGDVGDVDTLITALRGVSVVYHLAGSALGTPEQIVRGNIEGAQAVAAACASLPSVQALIYAGSGALYPSGDIWLDEGTAPAPAFHYARAKAEAELLLLRAHARIGLPVIVARIAGVYGLGSPNLMTEQVRRGRFPLIGGGHGYASYIHIDDTVAGLRALAERGRPGQIYNLADDEPTRIRDFYGELARLLGGPPPPTMPPAAARALVRVVNTLARMRGRPGPLPHDMAAMAAVSHRMTNRRMREELGVAPRYPSYRDGLPTCVS